MATDNRQLYLPIVQREASRAGVPWQLLDAVVQQESSYNPRAYNAGGGGIGAAGLGQLRGPASKDLGISPEQRFDPETNLRGTADYLALALQRGGGSWDNAYALYHAGPYANLSTISPSIWDTVGSVKRHAQRFGHTWGDATATSATAPAPVSATAPAAQAAVGLTAAPGAGFRGIDYPEPPQLTAPTTATPVQRTAPAQTPAPLSLREILGYGNLRPPGWYPG